MITKTYKYRAQASKDGSTNPAKRSQGDVRGTLKEAMVDAHAFMPKNKTITILRAETEGINAGKYFLHLILK